MTIAAITPPEGREEESFAAPDPDREESAGTDEVTPPIVVLPEIGLWRAVLDVAAVVVGGGDDGDDDDSMISDEADVELGTSVASEVEPPTTLF